MDNHHTQESTSESVEMYLLRIALLQVDGKPVPISALADELPVSPDGSMMVEAESGRLALATEVVRLIETAPPAISSPVKDATQEVAPHSPEGQG